MYLIYSLLFSLGVLLTAPYYLWRLRGKIVAGAGWRERFGFLPAELQQEPAHPGTGALWIHAVSVGETLAVSPLVEELQRRYPDRKIFLSHVTPAGRSASEGRLPGIEGRFFLPLDWRRSTRRVFERIHPAVLLIVETELWPNLLRAAQRSGTRVALVNARLSDRSYRGYRLARPFMQRVLDCVDWIGAQSVEDARRFRQIGAKSDRVFVTGNIKFDGKPPQSSDVVRVLDGAIQADRRGPVFVAASTMSGEETLLLPAWREIRRRHPQALMILAPRHPARFDQVAQLLAGEGLTFIRRTTLASASQEPAAKLGSSEILILDTIGELAGVFSLADIVFVGGSLVATGGHNVLEPAFWSKPILFGPHMENFRDVSELFLDADAAVRVRDTQDLARVTLELLQNDARRRQLGDSAKEVLVRESGATTRILERLGLWLDEKVAVDATVPGSPPR
jgi:3-deoxy-D-manno-octulosonic-acid transferase